jgi:dTDP-4-dehydrorhamnose 3,5-epimerase
MMIADTAIPDVKLITPKKLGDHRGFFAEVYKRHALADAGIHIDFVQDNHSLSAQVGTVRGLHFQTPPHAQAKLVRCVRGAILDVAVDIRVGSPTFGKHVAHVLAADAMTQMLIPIGFAHGFATLAPDTEVIYKVSDIYAPQHDAGILWCDPDLGIDWRIDADDAVLSDKDRRHPRLCDYPSPFVYQSR